MKINKKIQRYLYIFSCLSTFLIFNSTELVAKDLKKASQNSLFKRSRQAGTSLLKTSLPYLTQITESLVNLIAISPMGSSITEFLLKGPYWYSKSDCEKDIRKAYYLYSSQGMITRVLPEEADAAKHKALSDIQKLLSKRKKNGSAEKLNIAMIKIELGGGHKAAIQAMSDSILEGLSLQERQLINIIPIDFFGPDKYRAARNFNHMLETEDAEALVRDLGGKPLLEAFYDTPPGLLQIQRNLNSEIADFAKLKGLPPEQLQPDMVISAQPFGLHALSRYVRIKYNTQLRIVPTDFYLGDWTQRFGALKSDSPTVRYDASYDIDYLRSQFEEKEIHAVSFFGYPIRKDISHLADQLYSSNKKTRKKAKDKVNATISTLSNNPSFGKKGFKPGDQTALIMMGSKGVSSSRYTNYLSPLFDYAKNLPLTKVLHVYVAALKPRPAQGEELIVQSHAKQKYDDYYKKQLKIYHEVLATLKKMDKEKKPRIIVHLLPFLNAQEVGSLIYHGVTITKAGGSTSAEIAALGGRALFNMRISKVAPWERGNVEFLESYGRAISLPTEAPFESESVKDGMKLLMKRGRLGPIRRNPFQKTWGATVLRDLSEILKFKLAA